MLLANPKETLERLEWELEASGAPALFCIFQENVEDLAALLQSCQSTGLSPRVVGPGQVNWFNAESREREVETWPDVVLLLRGLSSIAREQRQLFNAGRDFLLRLGRKLVFIEPVEEESNLRRDFIDIFSCVRDTFRFYTPIYEADYLFDSRGAGRFATIAQAIPPVVTRGATIIQKGIPHFKSPPRITCPRCRRDLKKGVTTITFVHAPPDSREQTVDAWVCPCGESYVPGEVARAAHARAFGSGEGVSARPSSATGEPPPPPKEAKKERKSLDSHIEITPGIAGGKPRIAGHRITVQNIVLWHERLGKSADEIAAEYDLTLADIYAALAYYFDHREEIDRSIEDGEAFVEALRQRTPSKVQQKLRERFKDGGQD